MMKLTYSRFDGYMVTMLVTKLVTSKTKHFPYIKHTKHTFYSDIYNKYGINEN